VYRVLQEAGPTEPVAIRNARQGRIQALQVKGCGTLQSVSPVSLETKPTTKVSRRVHRAAGYPITTDELAAFTARVAIVVVEDAG
jgi:hypothetical protein